MGVSAKRVDSGCVEIGLSIHDGTYSIDFLIHRVCPGPGPSEDLASAIQQSALSSITHFSEEHNGKFIGAGITTSVVELCPDIASFLWRELDIIVMVFDVLETAPVSIFPYKDLDTIERHPGEAEPTETIVEFGVDEQADSAVRKAIMYFGPQCMPAPSIGFRNKVEVDIGGTIQLVHNLERYSTTVNDETWKTVLHYAKIIRKKQIKVAFFSATPQGGGVALMRHALIRFMKLLGVNAQW